MHTKGLEVGIRDKTSLYLCSAHRKDPCNSTDKTMKTFLKILASSGLFILILNGCEENTSQIPQVPVNLYLNLNNPEYFDLQPVNGFVYEEGGYRGIVIFQRAQSDYVAYDRASPYDPTNDCAKIYVDQTRLIAVDSCSGSEFQMYDGSVVKGPAEYPLKMYQTSFDGSILYIYN